MMGACFYVEDGAWTPWMMPLFVLANVAVIVASMYVNNCPSHDAPYGCVAGFLGRFSFQSLRQNPLLGPLSTTNKRPEFIAWLAEVKKVNLESLVNWEEKQMFKEFMEDHNTATFPSKKCYDLDAYHKRKMEKEMKKGYKKDSVTELTAFNDEEQCRQELLRSHEKQKEEEIEALERNMQSGMARAMKEQARLREEMVYQYRLGNLEAATTIQKRLDPDVVM